MTTTKTPLIPLISSFFLVHPTPTSITSTGTLQPNQLPSLTQTVPCSYLPLISHMFQLRHFNSCFHDVLLYWFVSGGQTHLFPIRAEVTMWPFMQTGWLPSSKALEDVQMGRKGTCVCVYHMTAEGKEIKNIQNVTSTKIHVYWGLRPYWRAHK